MARKKNAEPAETTRTENARNSTPTKRKPRESKRRGSGTTPGVGPASTDNVNLSSAKPVEAGKDQFLIAKKGDKRPGSVEAAAFNFNLLAASFDQDPDVEVVRRLSPPGAVSALFNEPGGGEIMVARMPEAKAQALKDHPVAQLIVEKDAYLIPETLTPGLVFRDPGVLMPATTEFTVTISILDKNQTPIQGATVYIFGSVFPAQAISDANGIAQVRLFGETPTSLRALYVKPKSDYWSLYITNPVLDPGQINVVELGSLGQFQPLSRFPEQEIIGWGQKAMKLDQLQPDLRGKGVKVAVIDSGAATTHSDLQQQVKSGFDTIGQNDITWNKDEIAHGSHCTGIIAGAENGRGVRGFAPEAEVFAVKIFPGGQFSSLIEALDHCIEKQVDVINLSLGSDQRSELLEQRIVKAKQLGIACIVAAGNSGGPVQFPGSSPNVLVVSAIGKEGEFPVNSYHATTRLAENGASVTSEGYFSAKFTCFGDEIDVCGPGVAIISSVPDNNYVAMDGTSMAAPHVTGLAALILAHHPDFQRAYRAKNEKRVERLFQILKDSCGRIDVGDPKRTGAGLPDALRALNIRETASTSRQRERGVRESAIDKQSEGGKEKQASGARNDGDRKLKASLDRILGNRARSEDRVRAASLDVEHERRAESEDERLKLSLRNLGLLGAQKEGSSFKPLSEALLSSERESEETPEHALGARLTKLGLLG